jgi:hypothetical protein
VFPPVILQPFQEIVAESLLTLLPGLDPGFPSGLGLDFQGLHFPVDVGSLQRHGLPLTESGLEEERVQ